MLRRQICPIHEKALPRNAHQDPFFPQNIIGLLHRLPTQVTFFTQLINREDLIPLPQLPSQDSLVDRMDDLQVFGRFPRRVDIEQSVHTSKRAEPAIFTING